MADKSLSGFTKPGASASDDHSADYNTGGGTLSIGSFAAPVTAPIPNMKQPGQPPSNVVHRDMGAASRATHAHHAGEQKADASAEAASHEASKKSGEAQKTDHAGGQSNKDAHGDAANAHLNARDKHLKAAKSSSGKDAEDHLLQAKYHTSQSDAHSKMQHASKA